MQNTLRKLRIRPLATIAFLLLCVTPAQAATYRVDPATSRVSFGIQNLLSTVRGDFREFSGVMEYDPARPADWTAEGTIQSSSIDTRNAARDRHLRTHDFFDAEPFPQITFKTVSVEPLATGAARVKGLLTIRGIENPVTIDVTRLQLSPDGSTLTFTGSAKINRKTYRMNHTLAPGMPGDMATITLQITARRA